MAFANGANDAFTQMIQVEPGIWLVPGVAYHYLKAKKRYNAEQGASFYSTEGFRPLGLPSDYDNGIRNTQWYYWVRKQRNPSAPTGAYPGGSMHGWGRAVDINLDLPINYPRMRAFMEDEGFVFDISDERWHANYYGSDMWTNYDMSGLNVVSISNKTPEELEEEELMTARQDILDAIAKTGSRGSGVVYQVDEIGRSYSVAPRCIVHHRNTVERDIALRESGQNDGEGPIKCTLFELARVFHNNGLDEFASEALIKRAPGGFTFVPGVKVP